MFGFLKLKPAPEGPVSFELTVDIDRPAEEVYALIDWADPRNARRALGATITASEGAEDVFRMQLPLVPDHAFEMTVTEARPHTAYAFNTAISPKVGRLAASHEAYGFEALDGNSCRLTLVTTATFDDGMTMKQFEHEVAMMATATMNALAKYKLHAEQGVEAVKAIEAQQMA